MKYIENLSNAIVQFEDSGFSSASAPPNDIYFSEEGPEGSMNHLSKEEQIAFLKQIIDRDPIGLIMKPYELSPGGYGFGLNGKVVSAEVYLKHLQEMASEEEKGVEDLIIQIDDGEDVFLNDLTKNQIDALFDHYSGSEIRSCFTCSVLTDDWDLISEGYECGTCSEGNRTDYEDRKYGGHLGPFSAEGSLPQMDYSWINYGKGKVYGEKGAIKMLKQQIKKDFPKEKIQSISVEQFDSGEWRGEVKFGSEEGSAPVMDPMELGEMANWTPMDGSPGLKRRRDAETYAAENQVFALTYFIENDIVMDDVNDVTEALELYLNLNGDILEMEELGLQKHPRYETANRLLSDLSYRLDELQTQTPNIIPNFELDAEYDAWRSAFTDGAAATQINKYQRGWMQKVMNPRSRQIKSMWNDAKPSFNEELKSAEMTALDRMGFRRSYGKPISALLAVGIGYLIYRKL
jgi:hypothetical protein